MRKIKKKTIYPLSVMRSTFSYKVDIKCSNYTMNEISRETEVPGFPVHILTTSATGHETDQWSPLQILCIACINYLGTLVRIQDAMCSLISSNTM
jgi:hypothetical protein